MTKSDSITNNSDRTTSGAYPVFTSEQNKTKRPNWFSRNIVLFLFQEKKKYFHPKQENKIKQTYIIINNNNDQLLRG